MEMVDVCLVRNFFYPNHILHSIKSLPVLTKISIRIQRYGAIIKPDTLTIYNKHKEMSLSLNSKRESQTLSTPDNKMWQ